MIIKAEDQRIVKVLKRETGWVFIETMWLNKDDVWERKQMTLQVSEINAIHDIVNR